MKLLPQTFLLQLNFSERVVKQRLAFFCVTPGRTCFPTPLLEMKDWEWRQKILSKHAVVFCDRRSIVFTYIGQGFADVLHIQLENVSNDRERSGSRRQLSSAWALFPEGKEKQTGESQHQEHSWIHWAFSSCWDYCELENTGFCNTPGKIQTVPVYLPRDQSIGCVLYYPVSGLCLQ